MSMRRAITCGLAGGLLAAVAACGSYDPELVDDTNTLLYKIDAVRVMDPQGPEFNRGLREGYLDYGDLQWDETDWGDYLHFAFKAVDSGEGSFVLPDTVESRSLPAGYVDELSAARARLLAAFDQTGRKRAPWPAALAQTAYDCWLERAEENDPPAEIEECKNAFERAIAEVERSLVTDVENVYLVFFAWDQADLSPVAATVLDQVQADYLRGRPARLVLAGHADRSGPEAYNVGLSERRARAVAEALAQRGMPQDAMAIEWYGESRPRVPTEDGVREPQNRRVEIVFG
jgi:OOP family OmpA-OmpF porin